MINPGTIARCSQGQLGLVTSDRPHEITYPDGNTGVAWTGIHLEDGSPWSSRNPTEVSHVVELYEAVNEFIASSVETEGCFTPPDYEFDPNVWPEYTRLLKALGAEL